MMWCKKCIQDIYDGGFICSSQSSGFQMQHSVNSQTIFLPPIVKLADQWGIDQWHLQPPPPPPHRPLQFQHRPFESGSFPVSFALLDFWCRQLNRLIEVFLRNKSWTLCFGFCIGTVFLNIRRIWPWAHLFLYEHYMHVQRYVLFAIVLK